jgi:Na+-translocating ferredoxin:NAD+ oxidoreductase subunit D
MADATPAPAPLLQVNSSPHIADTRLTTQGMMLDVLIALAPALIASLVVFGTGALLVLGMCVFTCCATEAIGAKMLGKPITLLDGSAVITGVILGFSLPVTAPWQVCLIGSAVAIGLGKLAFGGLGYNIFNPAMVGRAFIMLSFAGYLGAPAYVLSGADVGVLSQATPLTQVQGMAEAAANLDLLALFIGKVNGSLGETSALGLLLGGLYLCWRRSAAWEIPAAAIVTTALLGGLANLLGVSQLTAWQHLAAGSFMLGAFFIITDPVSSPLTKKGKLIYGALFGFFVVLLRTMSSYPEGVMFAVLLVNAIAPLLNRATIPQPLGGFAPKKA